MKLWIQSLALQEEMPILKSLLNLLNVVLFILLVVAFLKIEDKV